MNQDKNLTVKLSYIKSTYNLTKRLMFSSYKDGDKITSSDRIALLSIHLFLTNLCSIIDADSCVELYNNIIDKDIL